MAIHSARKDDTTKAPATGRPVVPVRIIRRPISKKTKAIGGSVIGALIVVIIAALAYCGFQSPAAYIQSDKYQAVYLVDGSVYFGKLQLLNDGSSRLVDVYYPKKDAQSTDGTKQDQSSSLIKFGSELLGGEDQIIFNKIQVAYWINLKADSKVTKAIQSYKDKN